MYAFVLKKYGSSGAPRVIDVRSRLRRQIQLSYKSFSAVAAPYRASCFGARIVAAGRLQPLYGVNQNIAVERLLQDHIGPGGERVRFIVIAIRGDHHDRDPGQFRRASDVSDQVASADRGQ